MSPGPGRAPRPGGSRDRVALDAERRRLGIVTTGKAYLEEVNTNGFMVGDDELYQAQDDTVDLLRLIGADGWPKKALYLEQAKALVGAFIEALGLDEHDDAPRVRDEEGLETVGEIHDARR